MSMQVQQLPRQEHRLILSPRMQQAIHLLQVPTQELQALIQKELVQNPLLEEVQVPPAREEQRDPAAAEDLAAADRAAGASDYSPPASSPRPIDREKEAFLQSLITRPRTLIEHLLQQLEITALSEEEKRIGEVIIGNIDENGYLTGTIGDISAAAGVDSARAERVLEMIQTFHPPGVGARDLRECLLLQLDAAGRTDPLAKEIVDKHLDMLAGKKYAPLARELGVSPARVRRAAEEITFLEPKPGRQFSDDRTQYVTPDLTLVRGEDGWNVVFNRDYLPRLRVNRRYLNLLKDGRTSAETADYIRRKLKGALWFIKNIRQREETLRRVMGVVIDRQHRFLERGAAHHSPMTMSEVAREVGVHESTVSRAVSGKYVDTPQGVFPLKHFFSSAVSSPGGDRVSSINVKNLLKEMVADENPESPLSDQEIADRLSVRGIGIKRRTVAKYRNEMKIPPSHLRRRY